MSIAIALSAAASGLAAASRSAQTISSNVANALTPGYAARALELESTAYGGVTVTAVSRRQDLGLLNDLRAADASAGGDRATHASLDSIGDAIGSAASTDSIAARFADLEAALIDAGADPSSEAGLNALFRATSGLVDRINGAGEAIQETRLAADSDIADGVDRLRTGLDRIDALNDEIARRTVTGDDANELLDQRRQVVDGLAEIVPIRQLQRENGRVALMTVSGQILLDSRPARIEFTATNAMTPAMSPGAPLSGLSIDGRPIDMTDPGGKMAGGTLAAHFATRDTTAPEAQARLDAFAWELGHRLQGATVDQTNGTADPGIFTDDGAAMGGAPRAGLAQRLAIDPRVDTEQGGETWRLRDGLGAAAPGDAGDGRLLNALGDSLSAAAVPGSATLGTTPRSLGALAGDLSAEADRATQASTMDLTFSTTRANSLREADLSLGVNTDDEMRRLLLVEQSYAANARVIEAAGRMIDRLMEI